MDRSPLSFSKKQWQNTWYELYGVTNPRISSANNVLTEMRQTFLIRAKDVGHYKLGYLMIQKAKQRKRQLDRWILPDQSWLVRSAGSDNSIMPVNSASTVSPPPHVWTWMDVGGVELISVAHSLSTFCFSPNMSFTLHLNHWAANERGETVCVGVPLLGAASSAPLVYSSIKPQLLPLMSPSLVLSPDMDRQQSEISCSYAQFLCLMSQRSSLLRV